MASAHNSRPGTLFARPLLTSESPAHRLYPRKSRSKFCRPSRCSRSSRRPIPRIASRWRFSRTPISASASSREAAGDRRAGWRTPTWSSGSILAAMLEYEGILQKDPDNPEVIAALGEVEEKLQKSGQSKSAPATRQPAPSVRCSTGHQSRFPRGRRRWRHAHDHAGDAAPGGAERRRRRGWTDSIASLTDDGNEPLAKFLIQHRLVTEEIVSSALERVAKKNKRPRRRMSSPPR